MLSETRTNPQKAQIDLSQKIGDLHQRLYANNQDYDALNRLIVHYYSLVEFAAEKISSRFSRSTYLDIDDLKNEGVIGLRDALLAFDPNRGNKFETYGLLRIRGAMLDLMRANDFVPRLARREYSELRDEIEALKLPAGEKLSVEDLAERLGRWPEEITRILNITKIDSLDQILFESNTNKSESNTNKSVTKGEVVIDKNVVVPESRYKKEEFWREAMSGLSQTERLIIICYYRLDMTMSEIGRDLDLSESRISQMHSQIIERLRPILNSKGYHAHGNRSELDTSTDKGINGTHHIESKKVSDDMLDFASLFEGLEQTPVIPDDSLTNQQVSLDEIIQPVIEAPNIQAIEEVNDNSDVLEDLDFKWF